MVRRTVSGTPPPRDSMGQDHSVENFYDYYTLLSLPIPGHLESGVGGQSPSTPQPSSSPAAVYTPSSIKKLYRRASLKHHPDKGGDPQTFIRLQRARKVLGDQGLRKRYDLFGLDSGFDDGASNGKKKDSADKDSDKKNDDEIDEDETSGDDDGEKSNTFTKLQLFGSTCTSTGLNILLRLVLIYVFLTLLTYRVLAVLVHLASIGLTYKMFFPLNYEKETLADLDRLLHIKINRTWLKINVNLANNKVYTLLHLLPGLLLYIPYMSQKGGWIFWMIESVLLILSLMIDNVDSSSFLGLLPFACVPCSLVAWYLKCYFWRYFTLALIVASITAFLNLSVPLCEMIVDEGVDEHLAVYSSKCRVALDEERRLMMRRRTSIDGGGRPSSDSIEKKKKPEPPKQKAGVSEDEKNRIREEMRQEITATLKDEMRREVELEVVQRMLNVKNQLGGGGGGGGEMRDMEGVD
jgi:ribosomal protein S13